MKAIHGDNQERQRSIRKRCTAAPRRSRAEGGRLSGGEAVNMRSPSAASHFWREKHCPVLAQMQNT
jgi:hypothetical protein